jgi:hypothetical protein
MPPKNKGKKKNTMKKILVAGDEVTELSQKGLNSSTIQDVSMDQSENGGATGTAGGADGANDSSFVFGT